MLKIIQLGKHGITENFIDSLKNQFKNSRIVKISILRSATRERNEIMKLKDELLKKLNSQPRTAYNKTNLLPTTKSLGKNFRAKIIGFTIILRR